MNLTEFQLQLWDTILKSVATIVALIAAIAGAFKYFRARHRELEVRREELAWKKTELIVRLSEHFDSDPNIQAALKLIELGIPISFKKVAHLLQKPIAKLSAKERQFRYQIDRFFDFFDRLYQFVCITKTLTTKDAECFTWYIRRIGQVPALTDFARENGYKDLLRLYDLYKPQFQTEEKGLLANVKAF
jgi:hypothetical protein